MLVAAMTRGSGSLPLLQFALAELWERRDSGKGCITQAALEEMGGVEGALSRHADGVISRLSPGEQLAARHLLSPLITPEGTRSERSEEELTDASEQARAALRTLVSGRLLHARAVGGRVSYEIAHEALIASWGTLRQWLDENAGQRALQQRIETAGAEWERLGRSEDLLWKARQLEEAQVLAPTALGSREQSFLRASRRAVRRQKVLRGLGAILLVLMVTGVYGGVRLKDHWETQNSASTRLADAQSIMAEGRALVEKATHSRESALTLFDSTPPADAKNPQAAIERWQNAEKIWRQALHEFKQADATHTRAERVLEEVLDRVHDHPDALKLLLSLTLERIKFAELFHRTELQSQLTERFDRLSAKAPDWREPLSAPVTLTLETVPPGAHVELTRYEDRDGLRQKVPVKGHESFFTYSAVQFPLLPGNYHLHITKEDHAPVDLPFVVDRENNDPIRLILPKADRRFDHYAYVPPGCFLMGSNTPEEQREFLDSPPLHRYCLDEGYLIGRNEVTLGDWLNYLDTLPSSHEFRKLLETPQFNQGNHAVTLKYSDGGWTYSFFMAKDQPLTARRGERIRYPGRPKQEAQDWLQFPLSGISPQDFESYLKWLNAPGRLPGARLCTEREWMRAASGVDDRKYPHGDSLQTDDANIDVTYGRQPNAFGPDEVGFHRVSDSPFGLHDMAGNIFEFARSPTQDLGEYVLLGGGWYFERVSTLIANRQVGPPDLRDARVGFRVCAPLPNP